MKPIPEFYSMNFFEIFRNKRSFYEFNIKLRFLENLVPVPNDGQFSDFKMKSSGMNWRLVADDRT